jgi:hypothetical protein
MKTIQYYVTSDNVHHLTEEQANKHESQIIEVKKFIENEVNQCHDEDFFICYKTEPFPKNHLYCNRHYEYFNEYNLYYEIVIHSISTSVYFEIGNVEKINVRK